MKPNTLPVNFNTIPMELKRIPRWVLWRLVEVGDGENKKWSKLPAQPNGQPASSTDPATWTDFLTAQSAYENDPIKFSGVGFVFSDEDNLIGVDLDDCFDNLTNSFTNAALQHIAESISGYMEISPSGTGVKIFTRADLKSAHVDHDKGLEVYPRGRYFTVTGQRLNGLIPTENQDITPFIPEREVHMTGDAFADYVPPVEGYDLAKVQTEILPQLSSDCGYSDWLLVGMALHHQFGKDDDEALDAWDSWSYNDGNSPSYQSTGINSCRSKWKTFKGSGATLRSLIFKVNHQKRTEALARGEIILDNAPMGNARSFLDALYSSEEGYKLVHYADDFYMYAGTH